MGGPKFVGETSPPTTDGTCGVGVRVVAALRPPRPLRSAMWRRTRLTQLKLWRSVMEYTSRKPSAHAMTSDEGSASMLCGRRRHEGEEG